VDCSTPDFPILHCPLEVAQSHVLHWCCGTVQATPEYASGVIDDFELNLLKKQPEAEATEAGAPILWPRDAKSGLIRKDPDAGKD